VAPDQGGHKVRGDQSTPLSLLERVRAQDAAAWTRLVALYQPLVVYRFRKGGVRGLDAEDVAQEVFAGAAAGLDHFRHDQPGDTFTGWLRGIMRNLILLHFRRNHDRALAEGGSDAWRQMQNIPDPLADADAEEVGEMSQVYQRALEQVRGDFEDSSWQAFWLTAIEGRSPAVWPAPSA
jgi:RNA polymerase sigma-70 factor (ECF subfamily)